MAFASFELVALDCRDPHALASFYAGVVGGEITQSGDDWVELRLPAGANIAFQLDPTHHPPDWPDGTPQQAHLDFRVDDLDVGERQVLELGAAKSATQPSPDAWRVFTDPAGHPFCLVKA
ncbi:VOC family protein [Ilumatobacter nonamiensis]|uniref:VOC family protein n=1 Tax=Ilumatobacter nonamiensis TaxID=467093 RepID=UPI000348DB53|nr:VOC family protein [Ilumatobacter nonamiensis]